MPIRNLSDPLATAPLERVLSRLCASWGRPEEDSSPGELSSAAAGLVLAGLFGLQAAGTAVETEVDPVLAGAARRLQTPTAGLPASAPENAAAFLEPVRRALIPSANPDREPRLREGLRTLAAALRDLPGDASTRLDCLSVALALTFERTLRTRGPGAVFTPRWFAGDMVREALADWEATHDSEGRPRFLDMSLGAGEFALAFLEYCLDTSTPPDGVLLSDRLHGWDLDPDCVWLTRVRLWLRWEAHRLARGLPPAPWPRWHHLEARDALAPNEALKIGHCKSQIANPSSPPRPERRAPDDAQFSVTQFEVCNYQFAICSSEKFDLIVGNPPYVALSQANGVTGREAFLRQWQERHPEHPVSPACDLSNFFLLRGAELLRPGGVLKFITSRNFFDTRYGAGVRRFLTQAVTLRRLVTLHSHPFTRRGLKVKASAAVVTVVNDPPPGSPVACGHLAGPGLPPSQAETHAVPLAALRESENWTSTLFPSETLSQLERGLACRLGAFCTVSMGVKPGANACFLWDLRQEPYASLAYELPAAWLAPGIRNSRDLRTGALPNPGSTPFRYLNLPRELDLCPAAATAAPGPASLVNFLLDTGGRGDATCPNSANSPCGCGQAPTAWNCDVLARRPSVRGHRPHWYHLGLGEPPELAVQCVVDTEIGVYWNPHGVWPSDQFQVLRTDGRPDLGLLIYGYLQSHLARLQLEHRGFHRARFDGSFMLKLQAGHLVQLPCPDLSALPLALRAEIRERAHRLTGAPARGPEAESLREELTALWLQAAGHLPSAARTLAAGARRELAARIRFRWDKDRDRPRETGMGPL